MIKQEFGCGMSMTKATIDFKGRKYSYNFVMPEHPTKHNLALAISIAKGKKEGVTKYTGMPKDYNLIMELLNHNGRFINLYGDAHNSLTMENYYKDASGRNSEETPTWNEETQMYERLMWRVGLTQSHTLIIDVDSHDLENLKFVKGCYEAVLNCKFEIIKTNGGYWLISDKKYDNKDQFVFDHCRVLQPSLKKHEQYDFTQKLYNIDHDSNGRFKKASMEDIKKVCNVRGNFDIMFTLLSIKRERSTIRISQKKPHDKIEVIKL
jgi:hypothetical protein